MDAIPPDAFLAAYPAGIQVAARRLRQIVKRAVPDAVERVRFGWRLIGYAIPAGRSTRFFAYVTPEMAHVHLGFEYGAWMQDPEGRLQGAHLNLRKVRYLTILPGEPIPGPEFILLTREAARVALMPRAERMSLVLDRDWRPPSGDS